MKIKGENGTVFEAHDDAAKELIARGDYVKAGAKEEVGTPVEPPTVQPPKRKTTSKKS